MKDFVTIEDVNIVKLIRDSERLEAIKDYVKSEKYLVRENVLLMLGIEVESNAD